MINISEKFSCCGCNGCAQICPRDCICLEEDDEGFKYPVIKQSLCIDCGACENVCPILNVKLDRTGNIPEAYAAYNLDDECRTNSSSGGIFTLISEWVISKGGIVFGATMADDCREVNHVKIESGEEVGKLRGSKYLQSNINNTFILVKQNLQSGKIVLFSGTPCQIEGLIAFLGKEYEKLICVDFICHGVPSPKLWRKYIEWKEKLVGADIMQIFFRHKKFGWKIFALLLEYSNNNAYTEKYYENPYMQMFLKDLCLRPSCYKCKFKKLNRVSDITLADFWGCDKICSELDDNKGLSLVLTHSYKGNELLDSIQNNMVIKKVDTLKSLESNPAMLYSSECPKNRSAFMRDLSMVDFRKLEKRYIWDMSLKGRIRRFYKERIRKFAYKTVYKKNNP